jgi:uncharacterized membrane protein
MRLKENSVMTKEKSVILEAIDVDVPVRTAYDQWTQFEKFPLFMLGVKSVTQLDDSHLLWKIDIGEETREWTARITEQTPDKRIAWTSTSGTPNAGVVTFHRLSDRQCRVTLQIDYTPDGFVESVGDMLGIVRERVKGDVERFKLFVEDRGSATGAFRGTIEATH